MPDFRHSSCSLLRLTAGALTIGGDVPEFCALICPPRALFEALLRGLLLRQLLQITRLLAFHRGIHEVALAFQGVRQSEVRFDIIWVVTESVFELDDGLRNVTTLQKSLSSI